MRGLSLSARACVCVTAVTYVYQVEPKVSLNENWQGADGGYFLTRLSVALVTNVHYSCKNITYVCPGLGLVEEVHISDNRIEKNRR